MLIAIIALGIISTFLINSSYSHLEGHLRTIEELASAEKWDDIPEELDKLDTDWSNKKAWLRPMLDHRDVNLTSIPIESMKTYAAFRNREQFLLQCRLLDDVIRTVKENQSFNFINIF